MYRFILVFFSLFMAASGYAQDGNYLYLDAENNQAFYVKLGGKVHSSSASGYLILTGLNERSLSFQIGFPKDRYPEQRFTIPMDNDDQGFHLKNLPEKGWTLINLKTKEQIPNTTPPKEADDTGVIKRTDAFSILLSKVVNDPAVLINTPQIPDPSEKITAVAEPVAVPVEDTATAGIEERPADLKDTAAIAMEEPAEKKQEPIQKEKPIVVEKPSQVLKLYDQRFEQRYEAVYIDQSEGNSDTIRISYPIAGEVTVPADKKEVPQKDNSSLDKQAPLKDTSVHRQVPLKDTSSVAASEKTQPGVPENKIMEKTSEQPVTEQDSSGSGKVILVNSDCKDFADDQDVDKLRVKILKEKNIEDKFAVAHKHFRQKCFTVKQIKALSELFPEDEYKYQFFELAYPFISDFSNFPELEELFMTSYYKNRFKTLIRN